jgi:hypothetical protein
MRLQFYSRDTNSKIKSQQREKKSPAEIGWTTILFLLLTVLGGAQENTPWISPNGTDPTDIRSRFDANLGRIDLLSSGYILELAGSANLAFSKWGTIGITVPFVYADFPSTVTTEVGDIGLNALVALFQKPEGSDFKALGIGADITLNTGDVNLGTGFGQNIVAPYVTVSFYPGEGLLVAPFVKEFIAIDKDDSGRNVNDLSLRVITNYSFDQFWIRLTPELLIDLLKEKKNLYTLRTSLGVMIDANWGFSADIIYQIAGERRFEYLGRIGMRYLVP